MSFILFRESYLIAQSDTTLLFRTPLADRLFLLFIAALVIGIPTLAAVLLIQQLQTAPLDPTQNTATIIMGIFMIGFIYAVGLLALWRGGFQELQIDLDQKTYVYTHFWPLTSWGIVKRGGFDDFAGVQTMRSGVYLILKGLPLFARSVEVGGYSDRRKALEQEQWLSELLRLPVLPYP